MMLFDSHCHLFDEQFAPDLDLVIERARSEQVARMVIPAVDTASARTAIALAEQHDGIYAAAGIHPESLAAWNEAQLQEIEQLAGHSKVVAIGEIGLDYYWDTAPHDVQITALRLQLQLAKTLKLPVIIHNRESTEDLLHVLETEAGPDLTGIMHCFSDTWETASRCLELGFMISFGGPVTFKNARSLQEVVPLIPDDKLLIETDSPYLSPHPLRGKRNEPARVRLVAEKLAELRGVSVERVAEQTYHNACRLFGLEGDHQSNE